MSDPKGQMPPYHTAVRSAFLVALHNGVHLQPEQLGVGDHKDSLTSVQKILQGAGLDCRISKGRKWEDVRALRGQYPLMTVRKDSRWVIVIGEVPTEDNEPGVIVLDPTSEAAGPVTMRLDAFLATWSGIYLECRRPKPGLDDEGQPFGLRWFLPEILRQKRYLRDVAIAATMCNIIGFATPMLFQVIVDKVIPHHSYQTLYVVSGAFIAIIAFDAIFSYVRQYLMMFASNKIDARLASRVFKHLLSLPMQFFEATPAGVIARHMQQTEKVRLFLTGRLFHTLLDAAVLPILLVLLLFYSVKLTLLVLAFSAAIAAVIGVLIPTFRSQLNQLYGAEGSRQAHLIETINGMRTIKSLALEPSKKEAWDGKVVMAVRRHMSVGQIAAFANVTTTALEKGMQIAVLGIGALDVFAGQLSIGALIAFNMLSGRVSGPLVQIVALINEYQETALSVQMLGHVMNHPPERGERHKGLKPPIRGELTFEQVTFRYPGATNAALDRISFTIKKGMMVGVVGRSGSGKTTVTRMIQGIHVPQEGVIRLDNVDMRHIDLVHLRRNVGVVLQESFLFRGTIRENIAVSKPHASLIEVAQAAQLAGAAEFIDRLPMSYDTMLEEGATNLSGGQRQRLSIARSLLTKPQLLIFDEATSALDPESEAIVQENLARIAENRTMIVVSHRLSSLTMADAIMVLDRGQVIDFAPHETLLERCEIYAHLWQQQTQHMTPRKDRPAA
ncbi:MAG: peptidase domain-containing ABC transporter [Hyphomicrobiaceae bacterium]|nr:peptidase domain-containing ABC transporter [Hyphomicrobiaceae bacterium]